MHQVPELFQENEFVTATVAQINKDLTGLSDIFLQQNQFINSSQILARIISELNPILIILMRRTPEQLSQFIYRVDLGENKYLDSLHVDPTLIDLTKQIVEREAQKVYLRKQFSS